METCRGLWSQLEVDWRSVLLSLKTCVHVEFADGHFNSNVQHQGSLLVLLLRTENTNGHWVMWHSFSWWNRHVDYCTISINLTPPMMHDRQNEIVVSAPSQNCHDMCQTNFGSRGLLLNSITTHSQTGCWVRCGDGVEHLLYPVVLILSADYEEQCV